MTQETVEDLERVKREMEELVKKKDQEINGLNGRLEDDASMIAKLQKNIKELNVRLFCTSWRDNSKTSDLKFSSIAPIYNKFYSHIFLHIKITFA